MRPTGCPSRQARKYSASACSKKGLRLRSRRLRRSIRSGGTQCGSLRYSRHGSLMNAFSSRLDATGRTSTGMAAAPYMPTTVDVFANAREHEPGDTVVADSGDHASILDGCILSRAKLRPFRHNRMDKLERTLERAAEDGGGVLVVVDGVFSMEGDVAPLPEIVDLCRRYGARL